LILLDIDPHDGIQEAKFLDILRRIQYQGIVIMDDIHLNPAMDDL
jgi:predicted O-methyltransferase YrrM